MYHGEDYDLAGFCVGVVEKDAIIDGTRGARRRCRHRSRFLRTALERLLAHPQARARSPMPGRARELEGRRLFDRLLAPTRIYVKPLLALIAPLPGARAGPHHRRRPHGQHPARAARRAWRRCSQRRAGRATRYSTGCSTPARIDAAEMYRTFNCGIGMVVDRAEPRSAAGAVQLLDAPRRAGAGHRRGPRRRPRASSSKNERARRRCGSPSSSPAAAPTWPRSRAPARAGRSTPASRACISDRAGAAGLDAAPRLGLETATVSRATARERAAFRARLRRGARCARARISSSSPASCASCRRSSSQRYLGRMLNMHPSLLPAVPRPAHPSPRARGRRCARTAPACTSSRPSSMAGR